MHIYNNKYMYLIKKGAYGKILPDSCSDNHVFSLFFRICKFFSYCVIFS